jgi:hypothetical protein
MVRNSGIVGTAFVGEKLRSIIEAYPPLLKALSFIVGLGLCAVSTIMSCLNSDHEVKVRLQESSQYHQYLRSHMQVGLPLLTTCLLQLPSKSTHNHQRTLLALRPDICARNPSSSLNNDRFITMSNVPACRFGPQKTETSTSFPCTNVISVVAA